MPMGKERKDPVVALQLSQVLVDIGMAPPELSGRELTTEALVQIGRPQYRHYQSARSTPPTQKLLKDE